MLITDKAVPYILLQRTSHFSFVKHSIVNKVFPMSFLAKLESVFFSEKIKESYSKEMEREFLTIKPFISKNTHYILDIGCGVAGYDYYLYNHTGAEIFLLDKTETQSNIYYGFEKKGAYYNSLGIARLLLEQNGVPAQMIHTQEVTNKVEINHPESGFDLVVSLISWGFHYPVSTYVKMVYDVLKPGGLLIIDIRTNTRGKNELSEFFDLKIISDFKKYQRYLCKKKNLQ